MPETNDARIEFVLKDITERIDRNNDVAGIGTISPLQQRIDYTNSLIEAYDPAIKGLDNKIVSIGQSINILKNEIVTLITQAVGVSTVNTCGIVDTSRCGIGTTGWQGGISTCLTGYAGEYYDTVTANIWGFSSTSSNPFTVTTGILTDASSTFGPGIGTFLVITQNNSSYSAGVRVSLGSSATCVTTQTEITRKDGEISTLRTQLSDYVGVVNKIRTQRWKSELERWGCLRAMQDAQTENDVLVGVLTAFSDSTYNSLFLR
jgi:hypothetical protein